LLTEAVVEISNRRPVEEAVKEVAVTLNPKDFPVTLSQNPLLFFTNLFFWAG
jgi:hypothetical protein